jgi:predicted CopG family antitoxin
MSGLSRVALSPSILYTQMSRYRSVPFKTISLDELAYAKLRERKRANESFSEVIHRILGTRQASFADFRGFLPPADVDRLADALQRMKAADLQAQRRRAPRP